MIIQVNNNPEIIKNGEVVAFITGETSVNTYPRYLRVGQVLNAENWEVIEFATSKVWKVYSNDIIRVDTGIRVYGVKAVFALQEQVT